MGLTVFYDTEFSLQSGAHFVDLIFQKWPGRGRFLRCFRKQCGHTEKVFSRGGSRGVGMPFKISAQNGSCEMSMCISILAQNAGPGSGVRHLSCKFPHKCKFPHRMALLKCPCACRGLAQNAALGIRVRHLSCKYPCKTALVKCPCAFGLRRLAQSVLPGLGIGLPPQHHPPHNFLLLLLLNIHIIIFLSSPLLIIIVMIVVISFSFLSAS